MKKSSIEEIKKRFDNDVERFTNLQTGQQAAIDADICLELITESAKQIAPYATRVLDIGCGGGNYTLKMLSKITNLDCTLLDLSKPMLEKAKERLAENTSGTITTLQGDLRKIELQDAHFDIILAGAVLHHLRNYDDWNKTFEKLYRVLKPGGCLMISDLIAQETPSIHNYMWDKYASYLDNLGGEDYRKKVLAYIEKEDSPRSMTFQLDLMKQVGFKDVEILHKNACFGAFAGIK